MSAAEKRTKSKFLGHPVEDEFYTYADYSEWDDDVRYELIEGVAYVMGAPTANHQETLMEFAMQFRTHLKGKQCRLLIAPFDVRLNAESHDNTVVQPDIVVICDSSKIRGIGGKSCVGAPDLVIEILSPSTATLDKSIKRLVYEKSGVREYWIVNLNKKFVDVFILEDGKYGRATTYTDTVPVHVLEDFHINLTDVFESINEYEQ